MSVDYKLFELVEDDAVHNTTFSNDTEYSDYGASSSCCNVGYERIIVPFIFCVVIAFGCVGNILVIVVVIRNREQYASTTNIFIVNAVLSPVCGLSVRRLSVCPSSLSTSQSLTWHSSSSAFHFTQSFTRRPRPGRSATSCVSWFTASSLPACLLASTRWSPCRSTDSSLSATR